MSKAIRKDAEGNYLRTGESYDKKKKVYSYRKMENGITISRSDKTLNGLRKKVKELEKNKIFGINDSNTTLNELFFDFLENIKRNNISESTYFLYIKSWRFYIQNTLGRRKVSDISRADIMKFYVEILNSRGITKQTLKTPHKLLNMTFDYAINCNIIFQNPCTNTINFIAEKEKESKEALSTKQYDYIVSWFKNHYNEVYWIVGSIFVIGCNTGMRIGEMLGLTWSDIDFKNNTISVKKTLTKNASEDYSDRLLPPKTKKSNRVIPMSEVVRKELMDHRKRQLKGGYTDCELDGSKNFVFIFKNKRLFNINDINFRLYIAKKYYNKHEESEAKIEHREPELLSKLSSHTMRHTFCTRLIANNTNVKVVQSLMGHTNINTTLNIYTHDNYEENVKAIRELDRKLV